VAARRRAEPIGQNPSMLDRQTHDRIRALPCWSGDIEIAPLAGGITNRNYRVADQSGQGFVVRLGRDIPEHGVLRFNELAAVRAAHAAGISPEVVFAGEGVLVSRFIDGRTLTPDDVRDPHNLERIADLVRRCHQDIPRHLQQGPAILFWVFHVVRNYLRLLHERDSNPFDVGLEALAARNEQLEKALGPVTIVFGHNDLLAANLIDDGKRLWLIDWDYGGFNTPLFDLANLASNNELTPDLENTLLQRYFDGPVSADLRRGFAALKCASLLRESLWGAVSRLTSAIDFNYTRYARDHLTRFDRLWHTFEADKG
jgi:thiamine kinase-like enzyme